MSASTGTTVAVLVGALVVLGLAMIAVAVWLVRSTRTDSPALGPLEVMGERRWRRGDADRRQTNLDTARPPGAPTPAPMVAFEPAAAGGGGGDGDGDGVGHDDAAADGDEDAAGDREENSDASDAESARSGHSSPTEPADEDREAGAEAPTVDDAAEEEPAVSVPVSEGTADAASDAETDTKE